MLPRVIPCLLLEGEHLVKTIKFKKPSYIGDPINAVKIFNEKEVDELVLFDIRATAKNSCVQYDLIERIASECFMPLAYGGGIRAINDVQRIISLGVEKVIIGSAGLECRNFLRDVVDKYGSQSVVVCLDVKRNFIGGYSIYTRNGSNRLRKSIEDVVQFVTSCGVGEIVVNSIDHDGMMKGYDLEIIRRITSQTNVPVMACGGAGNMIDIVRVIKEAGASSAAAGSIFLYHGKHKAVLINYPKYSEIRKLLL